MATNIWKLLKGELGIKVAKVIGDHPILVDLVHVYLNKDPNQENIKPILLNILTDYDDARNTGDNPPYPERLYYELSWAIGVEQCSYVPGPPITSFEEPVSSSSYFVNNDQTAVIKRIEPEYFFQLSLTESGVRLLKALLDSELAKCKRALKENKLTDKGRELLEEKKAGLLSIVIQLTI